MSNMSLLQKNSENAEKCKREKNLNYQKILLYSKVFFNWEFGKFRKSYSRKTTHKIIDDYFGLYLFIFTF